MLLFWLLAGLIAAGAAFLMLARARAAEQAKGPSDPELEVYRRQLSEIDELAERGLLGPDEHRAARAEAGRRLLGHAGRAKAATDPPTAAGRPWVLAAAIAAPVVALAGYLMIGTPGLPDQPYKARLAAWVNASRTDASSLTLPQMQAVLEVIAAQRPGDPQPLLYLAKLQAGQGDVAGAARTLKKATALGPDNAEAWAMLGAAQTAINNGDVGADARAAFIRAAELNPGMVEPRYLLGRADIADGRLQQGLERWRALAAEMPKGDARASLEAQIAESSRTGRPPQEPQAEPAAAAPAEGREQAAFIQSMVDRLAARLKAQPDDPQGWARLIRAYGVLGQSDKREAAMAEARRRFKDRPDALRTALAGDSAPALPR
jgi:cytochrome c-type biogenesis protein CcmH